MACLDPRDAEVLVTVARERSFGRAARELMVSQPAISERIRHLERLVGRALFERTTRGAALTEAGAALLPWAERSLALAREAIEVARRSGGTRVFGLAVHATFAPRVVPPALGALGDIPRRIVVRDAHSDEVRAKVSDGLADAGFALSGSVPRSVRRVALEPDPVIAVASPEHPLAGSRASFRSLRSERLAVNAWGEHAEETLREIADAGVDDWRIRQNGDSATAIALARDHGHIALVSRSAAIAELTARRLAVVSLGGLSHWTVRLDLIYRARDRDDEAIRALAAAAPRF